MGKTLIALKLENRLATKIAKDMIDIILQHLMDVSAGIKDKRRELSEWLRNPKIPIERYMGGVERLRMGSRYAEAFNQEAKNMLKCEDECYINCDEYPPKLMHYFEDRTKDFCSIDVFSDIDSKVSLNIPDNLSVDSGFCELPENKHFYYGGRVFGETLKVTYIIDIHDKSAVKKKTNDKKWCIGSCCYVNGFVYLFGGYKGAYSPLNDCEKYHVESNKWKSIADIPKKSHCNSSALFKNDIILTGCELSCICKYNIANTKYASFGSFDGVSIR